MADINNSLNTAGYEQAQKYYNKLKEKMINNIMHSKKNNIISRQATAAVKTAITKQIENVVVKDWYDNFELSKNMLNTLEILAKSILKQRNTTEVESIIDNIDMQARKTTHTKEKEQEFIKKNITKSSIQLLNALGLNKELFESMFRAALPGADVADLTNHAIAYFTRVIYTQLTHNAEKLAPTFFARALSLSGFYKEAAEYQGLQQIIDKYSHLKTYHAGSKNTELDIVISDLTDIDQIFTLNAEIIQSFDVAFNETEFVEKLLSQINWYGEQVKSWSFSSNALQYNIGFRSKLFNQFLKENEQSQSSFQAIQFLAKFKNILLALGPTNVLFATGNTRYWMSDFINTFRTKNYVLAFKQEKDGENFVLTPHVVLASYLTARGNVRSRFLT